eukprot:CAMPEP_0182926878 /NCGR_PEP_ID=MMETSP0105_2-20130417/12530_1 /TAXON_ID=81532 ORGANISM="Acanthoeca-like sp., Strain 10tr" /NCGR_SAMPLE_ID=MMETSP0105_2 /ASSEMBLY_ACC=CAM_ASM_000205 /LENGTH=186 /DNA_ID=CAMNT_0025064795 /DNA_START=97 /DNA_END=660 /DNA_ORIENTATION=+
MMLRAKCLVLGDAAVGKSALVHSFSSDGASFAAEYQMTTATDYVVKSIELPDSDDSVELHLHASAGRPEFAAIAEKQWAEPAMLMLCLDVTSESSFANLGHWLEKYRELRPGHPVRGVLVATKVDLEKQRVISAEAADAFAEEHQLQYFETSARDSHNVNEPFRVLAVNYYNHYRETVDAMITAAT